MEIISKIKENKKNLDENFKLSSLIIDTRKNELVINFHNNKEGFVKSFTYKNGEKVLEENLREGFKELNEKDELKEEDLNKLESLIEKNKHYIATKENGNLFLIEMDFEKAEIKKFEIKDNKKELKEKLNFNDIVKMA